MPIYEYMCMDKGHVFERWQKLSDAPVEACDVCGARVKKIVSESSFQLKGAGWYATDYKGKGNGSKKKNACSDMKDVCANKNGNGVSCADCAGAKKEGGVGLSNRA